MSHPVSGTTRYLCPLECGWHHDVPPPSVDRTVELGVTADPAALDIHEAITSVAHRASLAEADRTETALREHLDTHTTEQFVRVIHDLRLEVQQLRGANTDVDLWRCGLWRLCGAQARNRPSVRAKFRLTPLAPSLSGLPDDSPTAAALELRAPSGPVSH